MEIVHISHILWLILAIEKHKLFLKKLVTSLKGNLVILFQNEAKLTLLEAEP